jgi:hypothetical protein
VPPRGQHQQGEEAAAKKKEMAWIARSRPFLLMLLINDL